MKILFVWDNRPRYNLFDDSTICNALPYLGAILKSKGIQVNYVGHSVTSLRRIVQRQQYNFVCFSVLTKNDQIFAEKRSAWIRKNNLSLVIWGGRHVDYIDDIDQTSADFFVHGEAEYSFSNFLKAYFPGKQDYSNCFNVTAREGNSNSDANRDGPADISCFSHLDYSHFFRETGYKNMTGALSFISSRGCPYSCSYCHNSNDRKINSSYKQIRRVRPREFVDGIISAREVGKFHNIRFLDDNFATEKTWREEFCNYYLEEIGLPFRAIVHPCLVSEEYVRDLKKVGATTIGLGIEVADDDYRKKVLNRGGDNHAIAAAVKLLQKHQIKVLGLFMYGLPRRTFDDDLASLEFARDVLKIDFIQGSAYTPIVGTDLYSDGSTVLKGQHKRLLYLTPVVISLRIPSCIYRFMMKLPLGIVYREFYLFFSQWQFASEFSDRFLRKLYITTKYHIRYNMKVMINKLRGDVEA